MADLKKVADDVTTKAALAAGQSAAKRAIENLMSSDEERAEKDAEEAALAKRKRTKLIVFGVVGLLLLLGLVGMVVTYWQWFFLLGLLGVAGLYGRYRWRKRRAAKKEEQPDEKSAPKLESAREEPLEADDAPEDTAEKRARDALALEEAREVEAQEIDDELAAMKARMKK